MCQRDGLSLSSQPGSVALICGSVPAVLRGLVQKTHTHLRVGVFANLEGTARMIQARSILLALLLFGGSVFCASAQTVMGADAVLRRFEGRRRTHVTIKSENMASRVIEATGVGVGLVTLGGQYVEYRAKTDAVPGHPLDEDLQISTWDVANKVYRHWLFDSEGNRFERTGTWNEASHTLTWRANERGCTVVIHDRFVSSDRIEWDLARRDPNGKIRTHIDAWMTRLPHSSPRRSRRPR